MRPLGVGHEYVFLVRILNGKSLVDSDAYLNFSSSDAERLKEEYFESSIHVLGRSDPLHGCNVSAAGVSA
jgi:hypothetical protein